ncbi:MAG: dethiobiotin synthase [Pirellulales bacterium]|nr:dethiobiotin synthase [Pirellulales bacterium]
MKYHGLFITGTDTGVGKTYVGALIARALVEKGLRVGVYKPAASGCRREGGRLTSDDAVQLWEAAGRPGEFSRVCPQCFTAPLAPHLAARAEGKQLDPALLRTGLDYWRRSSDIVLVEGAGGLLSPVSDAETVADLARDFGYPLILVARNALGVINHTLLALHAARTLHGGLPVAGIVLNHPSRPECDPSIETNAQEITRHTQTPILAEVAWNAKQIDLPF